MKENKEPQYHADNITISQSVAILIDAHGFVGNPGSSPGDFAAAPTIVSGGILTFWRN